MSVDNEITEAIQRLRNLSDATTALELMEHRTSASIELFDGGFSTYIKPGIVERVLAKNASMFDIIGQPEIGFMVDISVDYRQDQRNLLLAILPPVALDLMNSSQQHLEEVRQLQDGESSNRFDSLQDEYLASGGNPNFTKFLKWGLIDYEHTIPEWNGKTITGIMFGLVLATNLPHVRYSCEFSGQVDGSAATVKQELLVNPRTAMITRGFDDWYRSLVTKTPRLLSGSNQLIAKLPPNPTVF